MNYYLNRLKKLEAHCVAHDDPTDPAAAWILRFDSLHSLIQSEQQGWNYAARLEKERKRLAAEVERLR